MTLLKATEAVQEWLDWTKLFKFARAKFKLVRIQTYILFFLFLYINTHDGRCCLCNCFLAEWIWR